MSKLVGLKNQYKASVEEKPRLVAIANGGDPLVRAMHKASGFCGECRAVHATQILDLWPCERCVLQQTYENGPPEEVDPDFEFAELGDGDDESFFEEQLSGAAPKTFVDTDISKGESVSGLVALIPSANVPAVRFNFYVSPGAATNLVDGPFARKRVHAPVWANRLWWARDGAYKAGERGVSWTRVLRKAAADEAFRDALLGLYLLTFGTASENAARVTGIAIHRFLFARSEFRVGG